MNTHLSLQKNKLIILYLVFINVAFFLPITSSYAQSPATPPPPQNKEIQSLEDITNKIDDLIHNQIPAAQAEFLKNPSYDPTSLNKNGYELIQAIEASLSNANVGNGQIDAHSFSTTMNALIPALYTLRPNQTYVYDKLGNLEKDNNGKPILQSNPNPGYIFSNYSILDNTKTNIRYAAIHLIFIALNENMFSPEVSNLKDQNNKIIVRLLPQAIIFQDTIQPLLLQYGLNDNEPITSKDASKTGLYTSTQQLTKAIISTAQNKGIWADNNS